MRAWQVTSLIKLFKILTHSRFSQFEKALATPESSQQFIFKKIMNHFSHSAYGSSFKPIRNYQEFSETVPIIDYADLSPWISKIQHKEKKILTPEVVKFFEKTSGSTSACKYIPYTAALLGSFRSLFSIWLYDILKNGPTFETGRIFMSISPPTNDMGMDNDQHYLQYAWRCLMKPFVVFPPRLNQSKNIEDFRFLLAQTLLREQDLEIISIWSPTYFLVLLEFITLHSQSFSLSAKRKAMLREKIIPWHEFWPKLKFISCWTAASAQHSAQQLANLFPHVVMQGKGLLATEAPITVPLLQSAQSLPLLNEVFFEFINKQGEVCLLHQLHENEIYELIISQLGGLYRYRLHDQVRVNGFYANTPSLEFVGRIGNTSDMVGEKLDENAVITALQSLSHHTYGVLLATMTTQGIGQYIFLTDVLSEVKNEQLEQALNKNFHYHNARILGQLLPAQIFKILNPQQQIQNFFVNQGMRWGDIKDRILISDVLLSKQLLSGLFN